MNIPSFLVDSSDFIHKQNAIYVCGINGVLVMFYFLAINN